MVTVLPAKSASWAFAGAAAAIAMGTMAGAIVVARVMVNRVILVLSLVLLLVRLLVVVSSFGAHGGRSGNHRKPLGARDQTPRQAIAPAVLYGSIGIQITNMPATGRRGDENVRQAQ